MNKQLKTSLILAGLLSSISGVTHAQQNNAPTINAPAQVTQGNAFEREMTPLLREISRKKSQLELRKLDRDLEKLDEESLKAQMGMESTLNGGGQQKGGYDPFASQKAAAAMPNGIPAGMPAQMMAPMTNGVGTASNPIEGASDIKVLMIYGFDDKLYAKVASGDQGGYAVKKGDVLPNGQIVSNVTANYIEVRKNAGKSKGPIQRIFVSQSVGTVTFDSGSRQVGGSASSARLMSPGAAANEAAAAALLAPQSSPGSRR